MAQIIMVPRIQYPIPDIEIPVHEPQHVATPSMDPFAHRHSLVNRKVQIPHFAHDPWYDHKRWHNMMHVWRETTLNESDINFRLWDFSDLHRYIEDLDGVVLVQPINNDAWKIAFKNDESHARFWSWYQSLSKKHQMTVLVPLEYVYECKEWVKMHVKGQSSIHEGGTDNGRRRLQVMIRDDNEAFEFKMRWYNVDAPESA